MKQSVVVIGHGSTSRLGVVRSIAETGCHITVIVMAGRKRDGKTLNTRKPFDCYSKYVNRVLFCPALDGEYLIKLLLAECIIENQKVILIPDNDFTAAIIDNNKLLLEKFFLFPHVIHEPKSFLFWMNKENQKELANKLGLNVPNSKRILFENGHYVIPEGINYPCFIKTVTSIYGGKNFFSRCDNKEALRNYLNSISVEKEIPLMAEDYKEIETEYAALGFSDGKTVALPGIIKFISNSASHYGIAMSGEVLSCSWINDLMDKFRKFILEIGFVGLFDIDFYYSRNQFYFGELNLRFGGSGYAITAKGVNLPAMLVRYFQGDDRLDFDKVIQGPVSSFVNERICSDDWYKGMISIRDYRRLINSADISFVRNTEDPEPEKHFKRLHRELAIKLFLKRLINHHSN